MKKIIPVDFETKRIQFRPVYPPVPVGVSVKINGRHRYLSWGHPSGNNSTKKEATGILRKIFKESIPVFHNAAFDMYVASVHLKIPLPKEFHDTLFLAYLFDPRESSLSLKPLADKYLDMPPEEQDELRDWILKHIYKGEKETKKNPWAAHIAEAPGKLVGKYARGDTIRTEKLFEFYYPKIKEIGMEEAYEREKKCLPLFEDMSTKGIRIALPKLKRDTNAAIRANIVRADWIRKRLKTKELDIESGKQLAEALDRNKKIKVWYYTKPSETFPRGQKSTSKENLIKGCSDKKLVQELSRYSILQTYISTFCLPWIKSAEEFNGRVYPSFNQVRTPDEHGKVFGTRTGRPSSTHPNFLNVPRNQEDPLLLSMRDYLIPDEGCSFLIRDYSQQELRILAHYEEGTLYQAYLNDPTMDAHALVHDLILDASGHDYKRKHVKIVNFGVVYGMGVPGTANQIQGTEEEAKELLAAHLKALPGVRELNRTLTLHTRKGEPIYTWGGRQYYAEKPKHGRDFYYKMMNYLIQGSAADITKEAMIRVNKSLSKESRIVLQVYDEIVVCCEKGREKEEMKKMKEAMDSIELDVPLISDGKIGKKSWGSAIRYKD